MIDQSLVVSGFDAEILMGGRYVQYLLLTLVETGSFRMRFSASGLDVTLHPPTDYVRLYEPNEDAEPLPPATDLGAFASEILVDHPSGANVRIRMIIDVAHPAVPTPIENAFMDLFVALSLERVVTDNGVEDADLRLDTVALELDPRLVVLLAAAGIDPDDLLPIIKAQFDRRIDLGIVGDDQNIQAIELQVLPATDEHPAALGVYLNLRLHNGPEPDAYLEDRGDLSQALNFLPPGDDLAFGMPGSVFGALADDARFRLAEETEPGSDEFHFPFRKDPGDPESEEVGRVKDIAVRALSGNVLQIDVHGEAELNNLPNPDFHFRLDLTPKIENGLLTFDKSHDVDVDVLGEFLIALVLKALLFNFAQSALLALIAVGAQELIVDPIFTRRAKKQADDFDASFLDTLPHRVTAERRRWDPLYVTKHQTVTLLDAVQITDAGIGFSGVAALGKEPEPIDDVVIRDEGRDVNAIVDELLYRVPNIDLQSDDFATVSLASDRLPMERVTGDPETELVRLTLEQVRDRVAQTRVRSEIGYVPRRVFIENNQIGQLLCISETEEEPERDRLIGIFREQERAAILDAQGDVLRQEVAEELEEELGQPPTEEQIEQALNERLDDLVDAAQPAFEKERLPGQLDAAVEPLLRFDMAGTEFFQLEEEKILVILGFERVRIVRDGVVTGYYRDRPDGNPEDNLMSLPRYTPVDQRVETR